MKRRLTIAILVIGAVLGVLVLRHTRRHTSPAAPRASSAKAPPPELERVNTSTLYGSYAGGAASAVYRGKRMTIVGTVAAVRSDAAVPAVILGSELEPVLATGIDPGRIASLVPGAQIEIDCLVAGKVVDMPSVDCGPNGIPRPVSPPR